MNYTTGQAVKHIRMKRGLDTRSMAIVVNIASTLLFDIENDRCDLSFPVARRLLPLAGMTMDEFAAMLSEEELCRTELSSIRYWEK